MRSWCGYTLCAALLLGWGCRAHPLEHAVGLDGADGDQHEDALKQLPKADGRNLGTEGDDAPADPTGDLTLAAAIELALSRHPGLRAAGAAVRQSEARAMQAALWPNPELELEFENFAGSGPFSRSESLETTISLAQTIALGGDIVRQRNLAELETQLARWDHQAARVEVLTEVTQRYVRVLAAGEQLKNARQSYALAEQVRETTRQRVEAGDAPGIELARSAVPVAVARVELRRAERAVETARKRLALMWGRSRATFGAVTGEFERLEPVPPAGSLVTLINENPAVARWATEIGARLAEARLAEAQAVPDVTGRIGYRDDRDAEAGALVVGLSLPLPIFDRRQGDVLAARLGAAAARQRRRETELRLEDMLSAAYARLADAHDEALALRDEALSPADEAFELTRRAFETGDLSLLDLIDAERTLVELRGRYVDALAAYHEARAEIEGLIGQALPTGDEPGSQGEHTLEPDGDTH